MFLNLTKFTGNHLVLSESLKSKVASFILNCRLQVCNFFRNSGTGVVLCILWKLHERLFYRRPVHDCFCNDKGFSDGALLFYKLIFYIHFYKNKEAEIAEAEARKFKNKKIKIKMIAVSLKNLLTKESPGQRHIHLLWCNRIFHWGTPQK